MKTYSHDAIPEKEFYSLIGAAQGHNLKGSHFLDLGCGEGTALALAERMNVFASVAGVDTDVEVLEKAKTACGPNVILRLCDVAKLKLMQSNYFIFMYDPFNAETLKSFLELNADNLHGSLFAYASDVESKTLIEFGMTKLFQSSSGNSLWVCP